MSKRLEGTRDTTAPEASRPAPAGHPPPMAQVLSLQRTAGNAALARALVGRRGARSLQRLQITLRPGVVLDTEDDFLNDLRALDIADVQAVRQQVDDAEILRKIDRVLDELRAVEAEEVEDFDDEPDSDERYEGSAKDNLRAQAPKERKPKIPVSEQVELIRVAADFAKMIKDAKQSATFLALSAAEKQQYLKSGRSGVKMGDVVERVGEGTVLERAKADYGKDARLWSSTKLRLMNDKRALTGDYAELDFVILDGSGAVVSVVSAKTSPSAVSPSVDRAHLRNYYELPSRLTDNQTRLRFAQGIGNLQKETLQDKTDLYFQYTESGATATMPIESFRAKHPLKLDTASKTKVLGLTPSSPKADPDRTILLALDQPRLFDALIKLIDARL